MPCAGPGPVNQEEVDKAFKAVQKLLQDEFNLLAIPYLLNEYTYSCRQVIWDNLRKAIADVFERDNIESF